MEAALIIGAVNLGGVLVGGVVTIVVQKWNRSKIKKQFQEVIGKLTEEIATMKQAQQNNQNNSPVVSTDPFNHLDTPSEKSYAKPDNPRRFYV